MSLFYCFSEKLLLIKVKARYSRGWAAARGTGPSPSRLWASLGALCCHLLFAQGSWPPLRIHRGLDHPLKNGDGCQPEWGWRERPDCPSGLSQAWVQTLGAGKAPTSSGSRVNVHLCLGPTEVLKAAPAIKGLRIQLRTWDTQLRTANHT